MRELDVLLERYLANCYAHASDTEKSVFQQLLTLSDPDLERYLLRGVSHHDVLTSDVITRILGRTPS